MLVIINLVLEFICLFKLLCLLFFRYMPRSGIAGNSILIFEETSMLFSIVATPIYIYIPTNSI